eukprot:scaffold38455_cov37-Cyclotella_meneghiniana.AAC.3
MDRPRTPKELRMFIGCVNYYWDMWPSRAHVLKPLTDQAGLKKGEKLNWTEDMQTAFDKMRLIIAADALAAYPNHNKPFHIYTDSSDFQLGACIMQEGRPVAYFSRKLSSAQKNYITMEKEMLFIVATLEEFQNNLSRLNRLPEPALLAKGKKLVEPAVVSNDEEESGDEAFFLEQEFSGLYDQTIWECIECYLNLPDSETPEENPLSYAQI